MSDGDTPLVGPHGERRSGTDRRSVDQVLRAAVALWVTEGSMLRMAEDNLRTAGRKLLYAWRDVDLDNRSSPDVLVGREATKGETNQRGS